MSGKRQLEAQIAALDALRQSPASTRIDPLRKALGNKNNFVVGKAADLVREFSQKELIPDLLQAFDRLFTNPEKSDPQCWGKNAIGRALAAFEFDDADVFLRGMRHIQMEPVWGGRSDTAGTLRSTCALALVQCRSLSDTDLLGHLIDLLADKDKTVRVEAAHAIEQVGSAASSLLLRQRAVLGQDEPEVLGACFRGILRLEGSKAISWVARFLSTGDEVAGEAALAIAATHSLEAFGTLREACDKTTDSWFLSVLLSAIALTRQDSATQYLIKLVRTESLHAEAAIEAVLRSAPSDQIVEQLERAAANNPRLMRSIATLRCGEHRERICTVPQKLRQTR